MSPAEEKYSVIEDNQRYWVKHGEARVGAISHSTTSRPYLYPLYTPAGISVLQESPPDHLHHTGIMVGQDIVNGHNFWHLGQRSGDELLVSTHQEVDEQGVTFTQRVRWAAKDGQSLLNEERRTRFESWGDVHFAELTSVWTADFDDLHIGKTKEGGVGMRVHQDLETIWGGEIRSSGGKVGSKEVFDSLADWVEICGRVGGAAVGIVMMPHASSRRIPWFVRDYGFHNYSPSRHTAAIVPFGESVTLRVGFAAYDGGPDVSKASAAWQRYRLRP